MLVVRRRHAAARRGGGRGSERERGRRGGALLAFGMFRLDSLLQMRAADTPGSSAAHSYAHFSESSWVLLGPLGTPQDPLSGVKLL